ncbi:MAG TPA: deoxycytidine triphosphate deaminase [Candidatus Saccharimonadales bacterium]|nr:deoxycytidine triphosphate deaminase [Candidatus Saccharimonadales bacterium]
MGIYSNTQIRSALKEGHIVCTPFDDKHVAHASLDVTLGFYYYRTDRISDSTVYNPFDEDEVNAYFDGPYRAIPHKDWCKQNNIAPLKGIPASHPIIPLRPGERILGHTHEFFGIKPPGAYEIKSRSSWGRSGIAVCFDAGWVDPGYINRLTLEIFNLNQHRMVALPVGERIAQAIFHETGPVDGNYGKGRNSGFSGKYQSGTDLETLIKNWKPQLMLPRAYYDKRHMPGPIKGLSGD